MTSWIKMKNDLRLENDPFLLNEIFEKEMTPVF